MYLGFLRERGRGLTLALLQALTATFAFAQDNTLTVEVTEAGQLESLIGAERKLSVERLIVSGSLNGDDILCLREMSGRDYDGNATEGKLSSLDILAANIVSGGSAYYKQYVEYKTEDNVIGVNMFRNTNLSEVILPASVASIKSNAFDGCSQLESVSLPQTSLTVGDAAFKDCVSLTCFDFANAVSIGGECLSGCRNIETVILPESLTKVDYMAFANMYALKEVYCYATSVPTAGYNAFQNIDFDNCKLFVPEGCATAYSQASQWSNFKNIIESGEVKPLTVVMETPGTLADIVGDGKNAVKDLTVRGDINSTDVKFLREMGGRDDNGNATSGSLESLNLEGANIVEGGDPYYYSYSEGLYTRADEMSNYFFKGLNLKTIVLPLSLKIIEGGALTEMYSLAGTVVIPEGVTRIGDYAFSDDPLLEAVILPKTLVDGTGSGFYKDAIGGNAFYGCHSLKSVEIPENVTKIKDNTFMDCFAMTEAVIPSTVSVVGSASFKNCSKLQSITVKAETPPTVRYEAFSGVDKESCVLHVPEGTVEAYKAADEWKEFLNIVGDVPSRIIGAVSSAGPKVMAGSGAITVLSQESVAVTVYSVYGAVVARTVCSGEATVAVPAGTYVVKAGATVSKHVVR